MARAQYRRADKMYESTDIMSTMPEEHWKCFLGETVGKQTHLQPTARRYSSVYAMTLYPMSVRPSVCLSVCLSQVEVLLKWQNVA